MYDTESTDLFQVKKGSYLATVEVNAPKEIWQRFAGSGLVPNEDSENRFVFETDGNNWNRFIIPDTYGNKSNNIKAEDVLTPEEYKTMLAVVQQIIPAGETQIVTAPIPYTKSDTVYLENGTPFLIEEITDYHVMQRYLQYDTLREKGLLHFDAWASTFGETVTQNELAPEGKGYRPRTRFSKFFNLPELMSMFKEVADIKTADELNLPTPEVIYETVVAKPTEIQQELVQELSERAARIHNDRIDPSIDNMLKVTSDGRKLGLDQRVINPMLPDDEGSKVNTCVNNILRIWEGGKDDKLTQLLFCDLSTPKGRPQADKVAKAGGSAY